MDEKKKVAYVGFSELNGEVHRGTTNAGIAQSNFTYSLISSVIPTDYFVAQSNTKNSKRFNNKISFTLRSSLVHLLVDSIRLFFELKKNNLYKNIVIYHSFLFFPLVLILWITRTDFTLQVNEIFHKSGTHKQLFFAVIEDLMFKACNKYILSTTLLQSYIQSNTKNKISILAIIPGPICTNIDSNSKSIQVKNNLGKKNIRIVYAGVIDKVKNGGAFISLELAKKLNDARYTIDIFGFGNPKDVQELNSIIYQNNLTSHTKVKFNGNVNQIELLSVLKNYDVGLATQYIGTSFSASSFPSKILTYLSAGLNTISATSLAVESWEHKDILFIYKESNLSDLISYLKNSQLKKTNDILYQVENMKTTILLHLTAAFK